MSDPARFNRRLSLQEPAETSDGAGGVTRSYQQVTELWAEVTPVSSRAEVAAAALGAAVTHRIVIRAPRDVTVKHRFVEGARVYRITSLRESDDRRLIEIAAEERTD
jgi:SPP1 family predicted phage head-tail adaptor